MEPKTKPKAMPKSKSNLNRKPYFGLTKLEFYQKMGASFNSSRADWIKQQEAKKLAPAPLKKMYEREEALTMQIKRIESGMPITMEGVKKLVTPEEYKVYESKWKLNLFSYTNSRFPPVLDPYYKAIGNAIRSGRSTKVAFAGETKEYRKGIRLAIQILMDIHEKCPAVDKFLNIIVTPYLLTIMKEGGIAIPQPLPPRSQRAKQRISDDKRAKSDLALEILQSSLNALNAELLVLTKGKSASTKY